MMNGDKRREKQPDNRTAEDRTGQDRMPESDFSKGSPRGVSHVICAVTLRSGLLPPSPFCGYKS